MFDEVFYLLAYNAVLSEKQPMFRRNTDPPSSGCFMLDEVFCLLAYNAVLSENQPVSEENRASIIRVLYA
jgi:hypothetical protein